IMRRALSTSPAARLLALMLLVAGSAATSAMGQGFMVKPMKMEANPRPGATIQLPLELRNSTADQARTLNLRLVELSQTQDGNWRLIEPGSDEDISHLSSCREWITLEKESVNLAPLA